MAKRDGIPTKVKVGQMVYTITLTDDMRDFDAEHGQPIAGATQHLLQRITIKAGTGPDYQRDTVLHEILHAVANASGLGGDYDAEEQIVSAFTPILLGVLRDNPSVVAYLQQ